MSFQMAHLWPQSVQTQIVVFSVSAIDPLFQAMGATGYNLVLHLLIQLLLLTVRQQVRISLTGFRQQEQITGIWELQAQMLPITFLSFIIAPNF